MHRNATAVYMDFCHILRLSLLTHSCPLVRACVLGTHGASLLMEASPLPHLLATAPLNRPVPNLWGQSPPTFFMILFVLPLLCNMSCLDRVKLCEIHALQLEIFHTFWSCSLASPFWGTWQFGSWDPPQPLSAAVSSPSEPKSLTQRTRYFV
jgi:ABC-type cobalamin transport system permease subunit